MSSSEEILNIVIEIKKANNLDDPKQEAYRKSTINLMAEKLEHVAYDVSKLEDK